MVKRRKRKDNFAKTIKKLVPLIYGVAVASTCLNIVGSALLESINAEIRLRLLEFKKMGVTEYLIISRRTEVVYDYLEGLERKLNKFLKKNKNYKLEKEDLGEKMFRYKLVRQYKPKPIKDDEYCEICGHYLGDD